MSSGSLTLPAESLGPSSILLSAGLKKLQAATHCQPGQDKRKVKRSHLTLSPQLVLPNVLSTVLTLKLITAKMKPTTIVRFSTTLICPVFLSVCAPYNTFSALYVTMCQYTFDHQLDSSASFTRVTSFTSVARFTIVILKTTSLTHVGAYPVPKTSLFLNLLLGYYSKNDGKSAS